MMFLGKPLSVPVKLVSMFFPQCTGVAFEAMVLLKTEYSNLSEETKEEFSAWFVDDESAWIPPSTREVPWCDLDDLKRGSCWEFNRHLFVAFLISKTLGGKEE